MWWGRRVSEARPQQHGGTSCCLSLFVTQTHWHVVKEGLWLLPLERSLSVPHFQSFVQGQCLYSIIHYVNWDA